MHVDPINKYNVKLIEDIYDAYPPEQADWIVEKFRKGGLFSVAPIQEEELEYSIDGIDANDLESGLDPKKGNWVVKRYDENGNLIEEEFDPNGYLVKRRLYDKDGKLKTEEEFGPDGKVLTTWKIEYDKNGKPIKD